MSDVSLPTWLPWLGSLALKSLVVFLIAGAVLLALRRASASARHLVCLLTLAALLVLPALSLALPGWRLSVPFMAPLMAPPTASREPTPLLRDKSLRTAPPETGREGVLDKKPFAAGALSSSSSRFGRTPVSAANKEVGSLPHPFPWTLALSALWLGGFLLASLRPLLGLWGIARLSRDSAPVSDAPTLTLASECASALSLTRTPALRQADAPVPMTWGWRRPVVLLPADAPGWPTDRLRAVLLHELAHVRRRDWLSHRFADLVCALYWFHPLAWLTARRLRAEGEIACDDLVLTSGIAAPDYARHLLDVARALRPAPAAVPQAAIAMAHTAHIEGRLKMILDRTRSRRALTRRALLLALGLSAAALVPLAVLRPGARAQAATPASVVALPAPSPVAPPTAPVAAPLTAPSIRQSFAGTPARAKTKPEAKQKTVQRAPFRAVPAIAPKAVPAQAKDVVVQFKSLTLNGPPPLQFRASSAVARSSGKPSRFLSIAFSPDLTINGTTLLAGVTDADKPGGPWWSATGVLLPTPVYDTAAHRAENHAGTDTHNVSFAIHLSPAAQDITVLYELPQSVRSSSDGFWPTKIQENENRTEAQIFAKTNGVRVLTAAFPPSLKKTSLRVGIASGSWKTAATDGKDLYVDGGIGLAGGTGVENGAKFLFSPASVTRDGVVLSLSTDATDDLRVIAVTTQGKMVLPDQIGGNSIGTLDQITVRFAGLPLAQIKSIRVETRPFRWVEIKDIALQPAK